MRAEAAKCLTASLVLAAILLPALPGAGGAEPPAGVLSKPRVRQPVALALARDGSRLFVANRRSGSLSIIDVASARVVAEHDVGRGLADVVALAGGRHLLAVDQAADALVLVETGAGSDAVVVDRLEVAADPVGAVVSADGSWCAVASRWTRRLTVVAVAGGAEHPRLEAVRTIELPFSPRNLVEVAGRGRSRLVAADAFGGRLAVVDPQRGVVDSVRSLPAHNIRGLAVSPDARTLAVAHQVLNPLAMSTFEDVHWGSMLSNHLRVLRIDALLVPGTDAELLRGSRLIDLGDVGGGSGDPAGVAFDRLGNCLVALAGVGEVAIGPAGGDPLHRISVGRRPTAIALGADGTRAYVADTSDDAVAIVLPGAGVRSATISLGLRPEPGLAERGEVLFHDARLSHDGWMSCHSCHTDGHSSGQRNDTLGDGSYGAPKRIPSLLGVGATGPWTWLGTMDRLEDQVRKSVETTMRGPPPTADQVEAIAAYLRTLRPPAPPANASTSAPTSASAAAERGRALFRARECATCHAPPEYTTPESYDVGLADEVGNRKFNPPSLRGVRVRALTPLLHDGRARTLEEVFLEHHHPRDTRWTPGEVDDLAAFLRSL